MGRKLIDEVKKYWKPPPRLNVSEWADRYRKLSPEASAEPGKWRTNRAEYQRGIMDAINEPGIETVIVKTSSQVGKSEVGLNIVGYFISQDPSPILVINPTLEMAETWSKDRLSPMLRDSPILQDAIAPKRSRDSQNTLLHKVFPGGHITMAGANSPSSLASRPIRIVICDEVDRYPASAGGEGDPINLAIKRTTTFWNRKVVLVSTPTQKETSRIDNAYEKSDKRLYYVPCPHCKEFQPLTWSQVKWEKENPYDAWYECTNGCRITNKQKGEIIRQGEWRATSTSRKVAGFHLNELYSPWRTFGDVVESFLAAKDSPQQLKVWVNTSLGESFDDEGGELLDWQKLATRAEPYSPLSVPKKGLLLTAGVDVQGDRLAVTVWAWGRGEECWLIYWQELYGDPTEDAVWKDLDSVLETNFSHEAGTELKITATAIDTGFKPQPVYHYCRSRKDKHLFPVKGISSPGRAPIGKPSLQEINYRGQILKKGIRLYPIGVDFIKAVVYSRLRLSNHGPGYIHFPIGLDDEFYEQLCAEKQITKFHKGFAKREWVKTRGRNEVLDCFVYAYAAAIAIGLVRANWDKMEKEILPEKEGTKTPENEPERKPKRWVERPRQVGNFAKNW